MRSKIYIIKIVSDSNNQTIIKSKTLTGKNIFINDRANMQINKE